MLNNFTRSLIITCAFASSAAYAGEFSFDLNSTDAHLSIEKSVTELKNYTGFADIFYTKDVGDTGLTTGDLDGSTLSLGVLLNQKINDQVTFRVGGKVALIHVEKTETEIGFPIGGDITYHGETMNNFFKVKGYAYISPSILSLAELDSYSELGVQGEYPFSDQLTGYLGFRMVDAEFSSTDKLSLSKGLYIGGKFTF